MVFSSNIFLFIFLPIFFLCYFAFKNRKYRNYILLLFSLLFYAWGEPLYLLLIILSMLLNYIFALLIAKDNYKRKWLVISLIFNIGLLFVFKYTDFFLSSINSIFKVNLPLANIALPIGISFYTFQILSYVIDVYRKKVKVQKNILFLGTYIAAFPQLIAGPIVRYETIEKELTDRKENVDDFAYGIRRFIIGLSKKVLLANIIGEIATTIFSLEPSLYGFFGSWLGMICYTLQIYFDFSGYSDMAIGIGRMLGFKFLENFNFPYIATSITDFWRRWHISLSTFFRDYLYIPLGGNKVKVSRHILNLLIVWFLTGLWHGASFNFILWGLYYGIILIVEKYLLEKHLKKAPKFLRHFYTILLIVIGWAIFRSENTIELANVLKSMFGLYGIGNFNLLIYTNIITVQNIVVLIMAILLCTPLIKINNKTIENIVLIIIFIISITFIITNSYNPFIYFRF